MSWLRDSAIKEEGMVVTRFCAKIALAGSVGFSFLAGVEISSAQTPQTKQVAEPVFRQAKVPEVQDQDFGHGENATPKTNSQEQRVNVAALPAACSVELSRHLPLTGPPAATPHPLDRALEIAYGGLENIQGNIKDYTATMVKRECVNGRVGEQEFMKIKVRNRKSGPNQENVPFSVYMKFLKPTAGREVLYVENRNNGNLLVHEPGLLTGMKTFELPPDGALAMRGNRHPIYEAGIENLVKKLIEKAERDRQLGDCNVEYREGAKINGRDCLMIEVTHPVRKDVYEFHKAQVFIDEELQIPVRFASYDWPKAPGQEPLLIEEYTYTKVKLNVGLTNLDFDPSNKEYDFPGR